METLKFSLYEMYLVDEFLNNREQFMLRCATAITQITGESLTGDEHYLLTDNLRIAYQDFGRTIMGIYANTETMEESIMKRVTIKKILERLIENTVKYFKSKNII